MKANKIIYKISGMDCPSCAMLIESELEDAGINGRCSYAKQTLEVENGDKDISQLVLKTITSLGYTIEN